MDYKDKYLKYKKKYLEIQKQLGGSSLISQDAPLISQDAHRAPRTRLNLLLHERTIEEIERTREEIKDYIKTRLDIIERKIFNELGENTQQAIDKELVPSTSQGHP